ncbi:MAG: hypothetical protein M3220_06370, partial [Chloroflexota bacterium]|nr:hypothetical protein [Chloroflexota bacterium]
MNVLLPLLLALTAAPLTVLAGSIRREWAGGVGAVVAALIFIATLWGWASGGGSVDVPWAPTWN